MSDTPASTPGPITLEKSGSTLIARVAIKLLDDKAMGLLGNMIDESAGDNSGVNVVVLDMAKVQFLPSLVLGGLVQMSSKCKARKQLLKLAAVQPAVRQLFAITKLNRVLEMSDTVEAAIG